MREGKISEPVWKRSVLKQIKNRREEVKSGPGMGRAGYLLDFGENGAAISSEADFLTSLQTGSNVSGRILFHRAVNACAAMGARPVAVQVQLLCPEEFMESDLREQIEVLEEEADKQKISLLPGRIESSPAVAVPYMTLNGIGMNAEEYFCPYEGIAAGQEILITKWIAMEATVLMVKKKESELLKRFTPAFVNCTQELLQYISTVPEAAVAVRHGVKTMLPVEEGGVFGALWELAEGAGLGLEVQARDIPVRQETIEICELYHKNPYLLPSAGSLLMVTGQGERLKWELAQAGISAEIIGRLTEGNDRVLLHEEEKRFLELPKMNELRKELI